MQRIIIAWFFVALYPRYDEGAYSSFMGKESQTLAKVKCMRGTDNQNVCPPIVGCYTHWTFWGLYQASSSALFPLLYVVCHVLLMHMGCAVVFVS